ncbi:hemolysin III family protein [Pseudomonadota bacterium]
MTLNAYSPAEERINIGSHALGLVLSIVALLLLVLETLPYKNPLYTLSFAVFGISLISLYLASTLYHSAKSQRARSRLRIVDHATIYILIAGTYTPFTLITLSGTTGWTVFAVSWSLAVTGVILKLFFTGRFERLSTLMYVFMGWIVIFVVKPMIANLPPEGLAWLVAGGLSYTFGAVIYSIRTIAFNHAIFHLFVLGGSFCHFMSVYFYVLPK